MKNSLHVIANFPAQLKVTSWLTFILFFINFFSIAQPGIWEKKQSLGIPAMGRQYGVGFSIGNKGYFGTGISISDNFRNDFWEYDPATNAWTQKADFGGSSRGGAIGFSIGNKGYLGTGVDCPAPDCYTKDFWEYDPALNSWTQKADFGGIEIVQAVGFSIGNKGYLGTGITITGFSGDFWEYDPATDVWTPRAGFGGVPRYGAVGFSIGNKGYIGTGVGAAGNTKDFWEYDPATGNWTQKADFGGLARSLAAGFSIGNKEYIGTGDIAPNVARWSDDFWEFDPAANAWEINAYFGGGQRIGSTGFNIESKGYIGFGGFPNLLDTPRNDLWEFIPCGGSQITTHVSTTTFCSGLSYVISYTTSGIFNADNIFTAQLSDSSGSFTNPYDIRSVSSTVSGTINAVIPGFPGTNFHIRVISSSPAIIGSDDGTSFTIDPPPVAKTKNITVYLNANGVVTITPDQVNNGSTGFCGALSYTLDKTTFGYDNLGANTVILTVKDANGRTSCCEDTVTVVDFLDLSVQVMPNPSQHYFTMVTRSSSDEAITVSVTDALGRVIDLRRNIAANSTVQIGDGYKTGIYFAQLRQGNKRVTVRLVKQGN